MVIFLIVTVGGGLAVGYLARPGAWYAGLRKPAFNPPNRVFGPGWTILYLLIAVAGWRVYAAAGGEAALIVWIVALALNFLWSPAFFGLHRPTVALAIVFGLLATIIVFIVVSWPIDLAAALLFLPYFAWVAFATILNAAVVRLN